MNSVLKLDKTNMRGLLTRRLLINTLNLVVFGLTMGVGVALDKDKFWYLVFIGVIGLFYVLCNYVFYGTLWFRGVEHAEINLSKQDISGKTTYNKPFRINRDMILNAVVQEDKNYVHLKVRGLHKSLDFRYFFDKESYDLILKRLKIWQVDIKQEG